MVVAFRRDTLLPLDVSSRDLHILARRNVSLASSRCWVTGSCQIHALFIGICAKLGLPIFQPVSHVARGDIISLPISSHLGKIDAL